MTLMAFVSLPSGTLDVELTPAADSEASIRPPLVFLHEGLGSLGLWRGFPATVRAASGEPSMLVYSRYGYGHSASAVLPRPVTYMHHEADVVLPALLQTLDVRRPILIGHSDGASIALLHAGATDDTSALLNDVAGLVLLAPHVFVEDVSLAGIAAARVAFETTDLRAKLARHHDDVDGAFRGWNDVWGSDAFRSWNITDRLPGITCSVLIVQGEDDAYGSVAQVTAIADGVSGRVETLVLPGVGHAPQFEAADATRAAIASFIASIQAGPDR